MADFTQYIKMIVGVEGAGDVTKLAGEFELLSGSVSSAVNDVVKLVGAYELLKAALSAVSDAMTLYDQVNTLSASFTALTGSTAASAEIMETFRQAAQTTRATMTDLATAFQKTLPLAIAAGLDTSDMALFTVATANMATATGRSLEGMSTAFNSLLAGMVRKRNDFLIALGVTVDQWNAATSQDIEDMAKHMVELSNAGEAMGQTFHSTFEHIKQDLLLAFTDGMSKSGDAVTGGLTNMRKAFQDPELIASIKTIGTTFADLVPVFAKATAAIITGVQALFHKGTLKDVILGTIATGSVAGGQAYAQGNLAAAALAPYVGQYGGDTGDLRRSDDTSNIAKQNATATALAVAHAQDMAKLHDDTAKKIEASYAAAVAQIRDDAMGDTFSQKIQEFLDPAKATDAVDGYISTQIDEFTKLTNAGLEEWNLLYAKVEKDKALVDNDPTKGPTLNPLIALDESRMNQIEGDLANLDDGLDAHIVRGVDKIMTAAALQLQKITDETERTAIAIEDSMSKAMDQVNQEYASFGQGNGGSNALNPFAQQGAAQQQAYIAQLTAIQQQIDTATTDQIAAEQLGLSDRVKADKETVTQYGAAAKEIQTAMSESAKIMLEAARAWETNLVDPIANGIDALVTGGGKAFGQVAAQWLAAGVKDESHALAEIFGGIMVSALGGSSLITPGEGSGPGGALSASDIASNAATKETGAAIGKALTGVIGLAASTQNAKISDASNAVQAVAVGLAVESGVTAALTAAGVIAEVPYAGWIAAAVIVVGAIVAKILSPSAGSSYQYGTFSNTSGQNPTFTGNKNVDKNTSDSISQAWIATANSYFESYGNILLKLGAVIPTGLDRYPTPKVGTFQSGADLGNAASAQFATEVQNWLKNGLPHQMSEEFKAPMLAAFTNMGMTADRFNSIWATLDTMDPQAALAVLNNISDALLSFNTVTTQMAAINTASFGTIFTASGNISNVGDNTFLQGIQDGGAALLLLGQQITSLPLDAQAAAAQSLGQSMKTLVTNLTTYLNQLRAAALAFQQSITDKLFQLSLDKSVVGGDATSSASKNAASALYLARLKQDEYEINNAAALHLSADQVTQFANDASTMATNIYNLDPTNRTQWYQDTLTTLSTQTTAAFAALGTQATNAVNAVIASLQPIIDVFTGMPNVVTPAVTDLDKSLGDASAAVKNFTAALGTGKASTGANASNVVPANTKGSTGATSVAITVSDPQNYVQNVRSRRLTVRR